MLLCRCTRDPRAEEIICQLEVAINRSAPCLRKQWKMSQICRHASKSRAKNHKSRARSRKKRSRKPLLHDLIAVSLRGSLEMRKKNRSPASGASRTPGLFIVVGRGSERPAFLQVKRLNHLATQADLVLNHFPWRLAKPVSIYTVKFNGEACILLPHLLWRLHQVV